MSNMHFLTVILRHVSDCVILGYLGKHDAHMILSSGLRHRLSHRKDTGKVMKPKNEGASESKKIFDISLTVAMGHLSMYIPVPR